MLHLRYGRLIRAEAALIVGVGAFELGHVGMFFHLNHVLVDILRLDVKHHRMGIREEDIGLLPIPNLDQIIVGPNLLDLTFYWIDVMCR